MVELIPTQTIHCMALISKSVIGTYFVILSRPTVKSLDCRLCQFVMQWV